MATTAKSEKEKEFAKYKYRQIISFFKLDDSTSRHLLNVISGSIQLNGELIDKYDLMNGMKDEFLVDLMKNTKWRPFLCFLGTYINEINDLKVLRTMCGWAMIALAYIEFKNNPENNRQYVEVRDQQVYDLVYKILCYTCRQHGASDIRSFLGFFGDEFFDQIVGVLFVNPSLTVNNFLAFISGLSISTLGLQPIRKIDENEENGGKFVVDNPEQLLKDFFTEYNNQIFPRLIFSVELMNFTKNLLSFVAQILEVTNEKLFADNFMYILDHYLCKAPPTVTLDIIFCTYNAQRSSLYFNNQSAKAIFVTIFNLSLNEEKAMSIMDEIVKANKNDFQQCMNSKFLGILLNSRQYMFCDKYFLRRKKQFAKSFAILLKKLDLDLLNKFFAKIFQTLWLMNAEIEEYNGCWLAMFEKLEPKLLIKASHRILFYISQLTSFEELAHALLNKLSQLNYEIPAHANFAAVLQYCYGIDSGLKLDPETVSSAALKLVANSPHLSYEILPKIFNDAIMYSDSLEQKLELIDLILSLVSRLKCVEEVSVIGACLGKIGAISPLYMSNALQSTPATCLVTNGEVDPNLMFNNRQFLNTFIGKCLSWFSNNDNSTQSDLIGYSLQCIAKEYETLPTDMQKILDADLKREIMPFTTSSFVLNKESTSKEMPLITSVNSHDEWIVEWFCKLSGFIKRVPYKLLHCLTLSHVGESAAIFSDFLPLVLLNCLNEFNQADINKYLYDEMISVFSNLGHRMDVKDSCQFIFSFFANVDLHFSELQKGSSNVSDTRNLYTTFMKLKEAVIGAKLNENDRFPCSVTAAIACSNYYSTLEILEKHVVKKDRAGMTLFDRELFSLLQRLYYNLNDVENTQGAYLHIINNAVPSPSETILNLEISGNIVEILPMISSKENQETMTSCILRLNQPELALAYIKHNFPNLNCDQMRKQYPYVYSVFSVCAMELGRWDLIEEEVQEVKKLSNWQPFNDPLPEAARENDQTFPTHLSLILSNCRQNRFERARKYFDLAEVCATRSLFKTNAEGDRPYKIGFEYVQQLHSLADIQMAWPQLDFFKNSNMQQDQEANVSLKELLSMWEKHDEFVSSNHREMEPILSVRRNILRSLNLPEQELKTGLTHLLVQSCKLARNEDLHYLVLPCLTEALKNGVSNIDIEEQRALFYSESLEENKRLLSIPTMNNAIAQFFPKCSEILQSHVDLSKQQQTSRTRTAAQDQLPNLRSVKDQENTDRFVESTMIMLEMAQNQRETCVPYIMKMYQSLENMTASSELFFYRYANFIDFSFKKHTDASIRMFIRLCIAALKLGNTYTHELLPRMITVWLDITPSTVVSNEQPVIDRWPTEPTALIMNAFSVLPRKVFYKAFPLLVSRLAKLSRKDKRIYEAMKKIMAGLLAEFPYQCGWLSIAEYRSTISEHLYRHKAMQDVYNVAIGLYPEFKKIIEAYIFIAKNFMDLAAKKDATSQLNLTKQFSELMRYFDSVSVSSSKKSATKTPAKIPIPLFFAYLDEPFKQIQNSTITIAKLESNALVMHTLARPKRIEFIGSDGNSYYVLCKPDDEMRKDARFMDLARMLNVRCTANKYTRNLGIRIRTFCVIPLQEKGGIIEWVPNVTTFGDFVQQGGCTKRSEAEALKGQMRNINLDSKKKLENYKKVVSLHKLLMAESLRKLSRGPASYYQVQRNYTTSTAFMCSIGFVVGLGDRHTGNILIDQKTGEVMHVDFCLLFSSGETLTVPEKVPFRLTPNVVDGFGPIGIEGRFRFTMERSMSYMQQEKNAVLNCLKSFAFDPLLEWKANDDKSIYDDKAVMAKIELMESRLNGYSHSLIYPKVGPFTTRGLVAKQIELAMDEKILCQMFIGWSAYV